MFQRVMKKSIAIIIIGGATLTIANPAESDELQVLRCTGTTTAYKLGGTITKILTGDSASGSLTFKQKQSGDKYTFNLSNRWLRKNSDKRVRLNKLEVDKLWIEGSFNASRSSIGSFAIDRIGGTAVIKSKGSEFSGDCFWVDTSEVKFVGIAKPKQYDDAKGIPASFTQAWGSWWNEDEEKAAWIMERHDFLVNDRNIPPSSVVYSQYWKKMVASMNEFESMQTNQRDGSKPSSDRVSSLDLQFQQSPVNPFDFAVIIGNKSYIHKDIPTVRTAVNDMVAFKKYAREQLGVPASNIMEETNISMSRFAALFGSEDNHQGTVFSRLKGLERKGRVYVYYSGHGVVSLKDGRSRILPADADPQLYSLTGFSLDLLYQNISKAPATERFVVIEACFSGQSAGGTLFANASAGFVPVILDGQPPLNVNVFTATSDGEVASWDESTGHSLFTKYYLLAQTGLGDKDRDGEVSPRELRLYVEQNVRKEALRQHQRNQNPKFTYSVE